MNSILKGAIAVACLATAAVTNTAVANADQAPAAARRSAATTTRLFLENATRNLDFLDRSSRLALTSATGTKMHAFAFAQARQQTLAANAIDDAMEATMPLQTGRSTYVEGAQDASLDPRLPLGQEDLNSLEGLSGADFDQQYKAKQLDALQQVRDDYQSYIANGENLQLVTIAKRELPGVQKRIDELNKL